MSRPLCILGAGGQGRVVLDAARTTRLFPEYFFVDQESALHGTLVMGALVLAELPPPGKVVVHVALGHNRRRLELLDELLARGYVAPPLVHERAWVSPHARLEPGSVVLAMAAVNCGAVIERGVIVNTAAVVEHDCLLQAGVHVAPGCRLSGGVLVGSCAHLGTGASTRQGVCIGQDALVGAGAVVVADVPEKAIVAGVPAKPLAGRE